MDLLEVRNIGIRFGGLHALNDVSLSVKKGQIYALIGPNGAGKTTLFNIISGFLTPTDGKIIYEGKEIQGLPPYTLTTLGISRTFQNIRLLAEMSVIQNVRLGHHIRCKQTLFDAEFRTKRYRHEEQESIEDAKKILEFVGLTNFQNELAKNLPYGLQRKLEIARTIATGAPLLLFDEPCAGMNTAEKQALAELIQQINTELDRTIFLIEHDMKFVMNISSEITVLSQGQVIAQAEPSEVQKDPKVIEAYLGHGSKKGAKANA